MSDPLSGQPPEPLNKKRRQPLSAATKSVLPDTLSADTQFIDQVAVALDTFIFQIIEQTPPLTDDFEQTAPGMVVLLMGAEVFGEIGNPRGKKRNLHLGRTGIPLVSLEFVDKFLFVFRGQHCAVSFQSNTPRGFLALEVKVADYYHKHAGL
jgi:hypothetical protein